MSAQVQTQIVISGALPELIKILNWIHMDELTLEVSMGNSSPRPTEIKEEEFFTVTCFSCGKEFKTKNIKKKFCSSLCNQRFYHKLKKEVFKRECLNCQTQFETTDSRKKFCKYSCYSEYYYKTHHKKSEPTLNISQSDDHPPDGSIPMREFSIPDGIPLKPISDRDQRLKEKLQKYQHECPAPIPEPHISRNLG